MKKPTEAQLETFVDFAFHQNKAEAVNRQAASVLVSEDDYDEYARLSRISYAHASLAVNIARDELGMTDDQIDKCNHLLITWAAAYEEAAA
jgi:hypothetical protein|tara:strand:- start:2 stop:274 length:273 start_codon:yes stop_codon:yes gene_type:complete